MLQNKENNMNRILTEKSIILGLESHKKEEIIMELSKSLYKQGFITNVEKFTKDVLERESQGPTMIAEGVALPHGISSSVLQTCLAVGICKEQIYWDHSNKVNVVVLFGVNQVDVQSDKFCLLKKIIRSLADESIIMNLKKAKNEREILRLLT